MNEYEKKRLENIKKNNEVLKALGLDHAILPIVEAQEITSKRYLLSC
jgi:hypothetical protein